MKQILFGSTLTGITSTSVSNYNYATQSFSMAAAATTEADRAIPFPNSFTISNFYVQLTVAPGAGNGFTYTIMKNGVATAVTVSITDANTTATDSTHNVSYVAGDTISVQSTPTGTPTAPNNVYWNMLCDSGDINSFGCILGSNINGPSTTLPSYTPFFGGNTMTYSTATELNEQGLAATGGTLTNMYALQTVAPGAGKSNAVNLVKNGSGSTLVATVADAGTTANDTTHTVTLAAGDTLSIGVTPSGTPAATKVAWGVQWNPTVNGESIYGFGSSVAPSNTVTNYEQPLGWGRGSYNATENVRQIIPGAVALTAFYMKLGLAPGVGSSYTYTLRKASAGTTATVNVADANTTGNVSGLSEVFTQGQALGIQSAVTGTPLSTTNGIHIGYVLYIAPPAAPAANGSTVLLMGV